MNREVVRLDMSVPNRSIAKAKAASRLPRLEPSAMTAVLGNDQCSMINAQ